ncbi:RICIN domain-containing protein [Actinoplanes sp. NBC_00393]|uniref:RICIN domain-containing protein n=1 Tax=Actinoplanes sp. NBC_00393 TaxID=2975953 RepID=UPI002E1DB9C4
MPTRNEGRDPAHSTAVKVAVISACGVVTAALVTAAASYAINNPGKVSPSRDPAGTPTSVPTLGSGYDKPAFPVGAIGEIASAQSGKCLEISAEEVNAGVPVSQFTCIDKPHQMFVASEAEQRGGVKLSFQHSDLCLAARRDLIVVQISCDSASSWHYKHRTTDVGKRLHYWQLQYGDDGNCLELPSDGETTDGTVVRVNTCRWNNNHQQWRTRY